MHDYSNLSNKQLLDLLAVTSIAAPEYSALYAEVLRRMQRNTGEPAPPPDE